MEEHSIDTEEQTIDMAGQIVAVLLFHTDGSERLGDQ